MNKVTHLNYDPNFIICLQETQTTDISHKLRTTLEYYKLQSAHTSSIGRSGGLLTLWPKSMKATVIAENRASQLIHFPQQRTYVVNAYVRTANYVKSCQLISEAMTELNDINESDTLILVGDLNSFPNHKRDHQAQIVSTAKVFKKKHVTIFKRVEPILNRHCLKDTAVELEKDKVTHKCSRTGTRTRIDFIFSNTLTADDTFQMYETTLSDHQILCYQTFQEPQMDMGPGIWRLNNNILPNNKKTIEKRLENWSIENYDVSKQELREFLRNISIQKIRLETKYKQMLESQIEHLNISNQKRVELECQLRKIEREECRQILTCIQNNVKELQDGNPKEIKRWARQQQPKTVIRKMKLQTGDITTKTQRILEETTSFYENLYKEEQVMDIDRYEILNSFHKKLSDKSIESLDAPLQMEEIEMAISKLKKGTSPGPDGLTSELYQQHAFSFANILLPLFQSAFSFAKMPKSFNKAIIKLLPKETESLLPNDYRPISLINTDQKILSHVIAGRLKPVLSEVIENEQHAYLPNRSIHQAILEIRLRLRKSKPKVVASTIDFSKAFDRVDRKYMFQILRKIGCPSQLISLIESLYCNSKSSVAINGFNSREIKQKRGVRQGCPLSALLFILALEPLLNQIRESTYFSKLETRSVAYADDLTVFTRADEVQHLHKILDDFCKGTQFRVNRSKSKSLSLYDHPNMETVRTAKVLGVVLGDPELSRISNNEEILKRLKNNKIRFNRYMSYRAKSIAVSTFVIPQITHIGRHNLISIDVLKMYKEVTRKIVWGAGRRCEIALQFLERDMLKGGVKLPSLQAHLLAAKIQDFQNAYFSFGPLQKHLLMENWNNPTSRFYRELDGDLENSELSINSLNDESIEIINSRGWMMSILAKTKYSQIYGACVENFHFENSWKKRIEKSCTKFNLNPTEFSKVSPWLWRQPRLTSFEKNLFYRLLFNCLPDKDVLWNRNLKPDPLCAFCMYEFENCTHLFESCSTIKPFLEILQIKQLSDIFKNPSVVKTKAVSIVLFDSWRGNNAECTTYRLKKLTNFMH